MKQINRSAIVPFSAQQMFALVDDIESYPQFLPWCCATTVHSRDADQVSASIELKKAGLHKTFSTVNRNQPGKMIEMRLLEGPFKHLEGFWRFQALSDTASKVMLDIEFEFSTRVLDVTLGPVFGQICNSLVEAFVQRAKETYGR